MAIPTGVDVPHVGHRTAPGCRLSPQVEHLIVFAGKSFVSTPVPYERLDKKIHLVEGENPLTVRG